MVIWWLSTISYRLAEFVSLPLSLFSLLTGKRLTHQTKIILLSIKRSKYNPTHLFVFIFSNTNATGLMAHGLNKTYSRSNEHKRNKQNCEKHYGRILHWKFYNRNDKTLWILHLWIDSTMTMSRISHGERTQMQAAAPGLTNGILFKQRTENKDPRGGITKQTDMKTGWRLTDS